MTCLTNSLRSVTSIQNQETKLWGMQGQVRRDFESVFKVKKLSNILLSFKSAMVMVSPCRSKVYDVSAEYWTECWKDGGFCRAGAG